MAGVHVWYVRAWSETLCIDTVCALPLDRGRTMWCSKAGGGLGEASFRFELTSHLLSKVLGTLTIENDLSPPALYILFVVEGS